MYLLVSEQLLLSLEHYSHSVIDAIARQPHKVAFEHGVLRRRTWSAISKMIILTENGHQEPSPSVIVWLGD